MTIVHFELFRWCFETTSRRCSLSSFLAHHTLLLCNSQFVDLHQRVWLRTWQLHLNSWPPSQKKIITHFYFCVFQLVHIVSDLQSTRKREKKYNLQLCSYEIRDTCWASIVFMNVESTRHTSLSTVLIQEFPKDIFIFFSAMSCAHTESWSWTTGQLRSGIHNSLIIT